MKELEKLEEKQRKRVASMNTDKLKEEYEKHKNTLPGLMGVANEIHLSMIEDELKKRRSNQET